MPPDEWMKKNSSSLRNVFVIAALRTKPNLIGEKKNYYIDLTLLKRR